MNKLSVAQSGSASGLGPEGREFESLQIDQNVTAIELRSIGKAELNAR